MTRKTTAELKRENERLNAWIKKFEDTLCTTLRGILLKLDARNYGDAQYDIETLEEGVRQDLQKRE